eukprot:TRINITY_DN5351_c0_g1_i1.p1 TRINITY_DN5351_c0_g1~~TRINITY_DN5351_c0_g1_i1.p1  ORF type:complete len:402 (+),score=158.68 TRINITY_DN5351_c0_g1_i1:402-1607(+)
MYTMDGQKYLDFTSGFAVTNTGHCHPKVVKAAQDQLGKLMHCQTGVGFHKGLIELTDALCSILPPSLNSFFFWNSGAEAVEAAVKLAKQATGRPNIIVFDGSFHGRTLGTMSFTTSKTIYRTGFGPHLSGVVVAPYPNCLHCPVTKCNGGKKPEECCYDALDRLELIFKTQTAPSETAAVMIEPILGEGGYVIPPKGFLKRVKEICQKHNVLMIADEVQCGFGRTGKYFAFEHFDFVPDIVVMAKGLASGVPMSAIVSSYELAKKQPPGSMGGTYGGTAIGCASAIATINVMKEEKILDNVVARGKEFREGLEQIAKEVGKSKVKEVRGLGLMQAMQFTDVPYGMASALSKKCLENGMLLLSTSVFETVRFMPTLVVTKDEIQQGLKIFEKSLSQILNEKK